MKAIWEKVTKELVNILQKEGIKNIGDIIGSKKSA